MLRHTALFLLREETTPEQVLLMHKGLAYMRFESKSVVALDYGSDLFGGSLPLREVKPWHRTPRWRGRETGPPCDYDVVLMLDFEDEAGLQAYNDDDVHHEVGVYNASICRGELTARVDWRYDGEPLIRRDHVRHTAMFVWQDGLDDAGRTRALDAVRDLESAPGVERVTIGRNVGTLTTDFDWILDVQLPDEEAARAFLSTPHYGSAMQTVASVTKYEWTARLTHVMRGH